MAARWTVEEEQQVLHMVRAGFTFSEIGEEMGRPMENVKAFVQRKRQVAPGVWRRRWNSTKRSEQPCWTCFYGAGAKDDDGNVCPWASRLQPHPDWDAIPTRLQDCHGGGVKEYTSYQIYSCPMYKEETHE